MNTWLTSPAVWKNPMPLRTKWRIPTFPSPPPEYSTGPHGGSSIQTFGLERGPKQARAYGHVTNSCCVDRNLLHHNWRAWSTTATKKFCSCGQMELATNQPESTEHCLEVKVSFKLARDTRRVTSHWWPWSTRTAFGRRWSHREDS